MIRISFAIEEDEHTYTDRQIRSHVARREETKNNRKS